MVGKRSVMKENNKMASKRSLNISENEQIFLKKKSRTFVNISNN